jgi:hypothetical protein
MDALVPLLVLAVGFGVPAVWALLVGTGVVEPWAGSRARLWREAARAAGLERAEETRGSLAGRAGELHVRLSPRGEGPLRGTRVSVSGLPPEVTVRPEQAGGRPRGVREIEVGDKAFDRAAWIEGPPRARPALARRRWLGPAVPRR